MALALALNALAAWSALVVVAVAPLVERAAPNPHCNGFLDFCAWNTSTSSCTFTTSVTFSCGPLPPDSAPEAANGSTAASSSSSSSDALPQDVGPSEEPATGGEGGPPSAVGWSCRWNVAGDLSIAPGVSVRLDGDDCALQISAGKMVLVQTDAALHASSLSIDASFVRVGQRATISASYSGQYRKVRGLFPGSVEFGASNGGSGGRRLVLNATMLTEQTTRGYFDVRAHTLDLGDALLSGYAPFVFAAASDSATATNSSTAKPTTQKLHLQRDELLRNASKTWQLDEFWKAELDSLTDLIPAAAVGGVGDPSVRSARFLLGSGSIAANASSEPVTVRGGGRIKIEASKDVVVMDSAVIKANGGNAVDGTSGGSGGSVYIAAAALSMTGSVEVRGGNAYCSDRAAKRGISQCYPAGGGGRVQISYMSSQLDIDAVDTTGGALDASQASKDLLQRLAPAQVAALAGASGTYFQVVRRADGKHESQLIIQDNRRHCEHIDCGGDVSRPSVAGAVTSVEVDKAQPNIDLLAVMNGAIVSSSKLHIENGDVSVTNGSLLVDSLQQQPQQQGEQTQQMSTVPGSFSVRAQDVVISDKSGVILPTAYMEMKARSVSMDASTLLRFEVSCHMKAEQFLHLDANISSALDISEEITAVGMSRFLALESEGEVILNGNTVVGGLWVSSAQSITVSGKIDARNSASIKSTFRRCKQQDWKRLSYDPLAAAIANFTILLHARDSINVGQKTSPQLLRQSVTTQQDPLPLPQERPAMLHGGAVLLCATDVIHVSSLSIVSSNGKGELANQGPGSGTCVGSIGGGAGYGGRGADSSCVNPKGDYASGGLSYGTRSGVGMLGSGGGCVSGGNGGGVVMLGATGLVLNGEVHCNGDGGTNGAGGGSGGFLGLSISQYLRGDGRISAVGGGSECTEAVVTIISKTEAATTLQQQQQGAPRAIQAISSVKPRLCGGGGGGGRLQLVGCELSDFDECTRGFEGNYTVAGGATSIGITESDDDGTAAGDTSPASVVPAASSGTFFGFPCPPGSGGLFCRICPVGTYKSESNSEECLACSNAPTNAHYVAAGATSADCDWTCDPGYSGYYCVSPLQQLLEACGGEFGFALVLLSIMTFFILVGYACRSRKEPSYTVRVSKGERQHLLSSAVSQRSRFRWLFRCFFWPRVRYPKLLERDLPEHMARLYLAGTNDSDSPLRLRTTVPLSLKQVLYDDEFRQLAEEINDAMAWGSGGVCSSGGQFLRAVVSVLCYPFTSHVTLLLRHLRVNALKRLVAKYNHACMKGPRARWLLNAVKLGYCADYSLVYLELLHKESSQSVCVPTTKIGKPSLPSVLLFAGTGTYFSPFYLDPNDLLVRAIPQCPELTAFIDEPWVEFVAELNELLRVVHRDELVESLVPVARYLERKMAVSSGKLGGLRIYLGRFYVQDEVEVGEEFKLGIFLTTANEESATTAGMTTEFSSSQPISGGGHRRVKSVTSRLFVKDPRGGVGSGYYTGRDLYAGGSGLSSSLDLDPGYKNGSNGGGASSFGAMDSLPYDASLWSQGGPRLGRRGSNSNVLATAAGAVSNAGIGTATAATKPGSNATAMSFSRIREEALRVRTSTSGSMDITGNPRVSALGDSPGLLYPGGGKKKKAKTRLRRRRTFYEGWQGPVDASLPVPGVLISADELEDRLADRSKGDAISSFLRYHLLPRNVPRSSSLNLLWMLSISLLSLLMVDLAITFAMVVNLKCVTNGEVDQNCSATILIPVLLVPPLALVLSPIMGIVSLALSSSTFTRRYSVWNALSIVSVGIAIVACMARSSRLLAPWFAGPLPLLPAIALGVKAGQAYLIERYIAFQETHRRRRGWRGLMKRRLSDASIPPESP